MQQLLSLAMQNQKQVLFTHQFFLLCLSTALFSASFNMIIPELPDYLTSLGGAEYKGLIIGLFTLTAGLARPLSGKLTDTVGRVPVMIIGTIVCVVCSRFARIRSQGKIRRPWHMILSPDLYSNSSSDCVLQPLCKIPADPGRGPYALICKCKCKKHSL